MAALPFVVIQPARFGTSSLEQRVARAALALPPGGLFLVDAWLQPDLVGDTLDALSRVVFSLPAPPAAVVVFAPASERLFIAEQLIDAFILRTGVEDAFQREIAASLRTAAWLRWLGPRGQVVSGLLSGVSARVRRLLRR